MLLSLTRMGRGPIWGSRRLNKIRTSRYLKDNRNGKEDEFKGIAALSQGNGYILHLCPGGGNQEFSRNQIDVLMQEAIPIIVTKRMQIIGISNNIGRHPKATLNRFEQWQADQLKSLQDRTGSST